MITFTIPEHTSAKAVKLASIDEDLFDRVEGILFFALGGIIEAIATVIANAPPPPEPVEGQDPEPLASPLSALQSKLLGVTRRAIEEDSYRRALAKKIVLAGLTQGALPATDEMLESIGNGRKRYRQELIPDANLKLFVEEVINDVTLIEQVL
jgi:hypothetical protein